MEVFVDKRSKNATIKRMIELGLIAERSEILPSKRKKSRKSQPNTEDASSDSDASDESDDAPDSRPVKVTILQTKKSKSKPPKPKQQPMRQLPKIHLKVADIQRQVNEIDDSLKVHFEWIQESLNDAAEDVDDNDDSTDPSDGVPIVPFSMAQREAMENPQIKSLLQALGLQEPVKEMVSLTFIYEEFHFHHY